MNMTPNDMRTAGSPLKKIGLRALLGFCAVLPLLGGAGCKDKAAVAGPVYAPQSAYKNDRNFAFAVHPLYNPVKLNEVYQPLILELDARIPNATFDLEASRNYAEYEAKIRARKPEVLLPNPWQTLLAMKSGYHVIAMAGDPLDFKGIFIVRKDSPVKQPIDLKGKAVSYPAPTALAACIMPQYFLHQHGINVKKDLLNKYVGSQDSSIMNVFLGLTAAAATWPPPWRAFQKENPEKAADLKVIWETEPLINNAVMARDDLPAEVQSALAGMLTHLHETPEGRKALDSAGIDRFRPATDRDYQIVRDFVATFESQVRQVEE
jgi:phosphonate transport system substrate-binding protein